MLQRAAYGTREAVVSHRGTGRRGPSRTSVRLRLYLLPEGSKVPRFKGRNSDTELVATHHACNYGFPSKTDKSVSFAFGSSDDDIQRALRELYPHPAASVRFQLNKLENRRLVKVTEPVSSLYGFKGVVFLTLITETDARSTASAVLTPSQVLTALQPPVATSPPRAITPFAAIVPPLPRSTRAPSPQLSTPPSPQVQMSDASTSPLPHTPVSSPDFLH